MPNLGVFHPQVVHFAIALLVVGVLLRVVSVFTKRAWLNPAAATLLILGTLAAVVSVRSGDDAHGPVERVPGSRPSVIEHEEWGERTRNVFLIVSAIELLALALAPERRRFARMATAALGLFGVYAVYETGEHGGELVYSYAGGVGIRTGETADVTRLLLAGLYHQAMLDRREHRPEAAARLFAEMKARWPNEAEVQYLAADSRLRDANDPSGALADIDAGLATIQDPRIKRNATLVRVYAFLALGEKDSARAVVERLAAENPANARYRALADSIK
jgi:uncharacterized membrane protein